MLFHSSIRQELARSFVATLVVLITVVLSMMLIRSLGLAAKGSVNPRDVIMLMGYSGLGNLPTIMTLALFIAVTSTVSRMYRESEMAVWFASGKGVASFISPLMRFSWPILLAIAALALVVWPWASQQTNKLRSQYEQRSDLDRVSAGQFQENASGSRVFFVEAGAALTPQASAATNGTGTAADLLNRQSKNIFVSDTTGDKQVITSARSGAIERIDKDVFVVLNNGQRMEQTKNGNELKLIQFEHYSVLANSAKLGTPRDPPAKSLDSLTLITKPSPVNMAELSWRIGLALAAVNLLLLALLLSAVNPRAGRGFGIAFALLAFVVYYNLLNVGYSRIANGRMDALTWMLMLHGGIFALITVWMWARHNQWSWRQLLP